MAVPTGNFSVEIGATISFGNDSNTVVMGLNLDLANDPNGLQTDDGRISADCDLQDKGDGVGAGLYGWGAKCSFATNPIVGEVIDIYLGFSDGTSGFNITANTGFSAPSALKGSTWIGQIVANTITAANVFTAYGHVFIPTPHVAVMWWNGTSRDLATSASLSTFYLWPLLYKKF